MSWLPQNRSQQIAGGIALLALILSLLIFLPIVSWLWILLTGPLAIFAGYWALAAERRTSWQDWIVEHVVGITAVLAMWTILAALALWAVVNFGRAPLYERRQPVMVLDEGDVAVTAVTPGGVLTDGKPRPITVWMDNGTAVTQTVTTTLQLPDDSPVTLLSPKRLITEVGPRRTVTGTLLLVNGKNGEFPQGAMAEVEVAVTAVVNGKSGEATTTFQAEGNGGARLRRFVTATVDKASPLIIVIAFLIPALSTLMQKYVSRYREKQAQEEKEEVWRLFESMRHHLRNVEIDQADETWQRWQANERWQDYFQEERERSRNLLALARLETPEEIKTQIQNGRKWPNACIAAFVAAWEKCRQQQFTIDCHRALQDARHLLPISEAEPDLQDRLALISREILAQKQQDHDPPQIENWPIPPRQAIVSSQTSPWIRENIPGGQDPFAYEKAEHDLFNLFHGVHRTKEKAFWQGDLFKGLFTYDRPVIISGATGSGRTALAYALHYEAPRRKVLALHIPGMPDPSVIRRRFVAHLLDFILQHPQSLRFLTGAERTLIAELMTSTWGRNAIIARIERCQADIYAPPDLLTHDKRSIYGEHLQLLTKAVVNIPTSTSSRNWIKDLSTVVKAFRFERVLLVLDVPEEGENWVKDTILSRLTDWNVDGLLTILLLPDALSEKIKDHEEIFYQRRLSWDRAGFHKMLDWRYDVLVGSESDHEQHYESGMLEQHFEAGVLDEIINDCWSGGEYIPQRFIKIWQKKVGELSREHLRQEAVKKISMAKERGEFAPIKDWPVPPRQPLYSVSVTSWVREAIPGGQDPFLNIEAEQDLFNLFSGRREIAFWGGHPLFNKLFTIDQSIIVSGSVGCGRTALAYALHYYAPRREVIAVHIPGTPDLDMIYQSFARHLLEFVLQYPQNLRFITESNRILLANLLAQAMGNTTVKAQIENRQANLNTSFIQMSEEEKVICGEQLQLLAETVTKTEKELNWANAISIVTQALHFNRVLLVLDAPEESKNWLQMILPRLANWQLEGLITVLFIPDELAAQLDKMGQGFHHRSMIWDRSSFYKMLQWRYKAFAGPRYVLEQHFESGVLEELIDLCSVENNYNPQQFMLLWQVITNEMSASEEMRITRDDVEQAASYLTETMATTTSALDEEKEGRIQAIPSSDILRKILANYFDLGELRMLCFDLGISHENFSNVKTNMTREMIEYLERRERLNELWQEICRQRPNVCEDNG